MTSAARRLPERLDTPRLVLRPLDYADAPTVVALAGDWEVARWVADVPHPYTLQAAQLWIQAGRILRAQGRQIKFAAELRDGSGDPAHRMIGVIEIALEGGEFGYWLGRPYWGRGYACEMGRALQALAFDRLGLPEVHAATMLANAASCRVLEKLGLSYAGIGTYDFNLRGGMLPCHLYTLSREDWRRRAAAERAQAVD